MRAPAVLFVVAAALAGVSPARAQDAPAKAAREDLLALEAKRLLPLLRIAVKEDHRRQVWYLANRVLAAEPKNAEAEGLLKKWTPSEALEGQPASKAFVAKRDPVLQHLGDAYAQVAHDLAASGAPAAETAPLYERALAYGSQSPDATAWLASSNQVWKGTFLAVSKDDLAKGLGSVAESVTFPPEWDDDYLRVRVVWPEAKVARLRRWRFITSQAPADAWRSLAALAAEETHFVATFGSTAKENREEDLTTDLVLVPDAATYDRLAPSIFSDDTRGTRVTPEELADTSGFYYAWRRRLLVLDRPRDMPWVPADANLLGWAARALVRHHLGFATSGSVTGRGSWILDGVQGVYEGFVAKTPEEGTVEPTRMWRLSLARALRDQGSLLPWPHLLELDRAAADQVPKVDATVRFDGQARPTRKMDVVAAQATALVLGLWRMDDGKGVKKLSSLLQEEYKRDRLPDLDKFLATRPGTALAVAAKAIDLADAR